MTETQAANPAQTGRRNNFSVEIKNIPIIFSPGIMGSRFTIPDTGMRWDPLPSGEISHGFNLGGALSLLTTTAETQRRNMHHCYPAKIYEDGPELKAGEAKGARKLRSEKERGYAGVLSDNYYDFLRYMYHFNVPPNYNMNVYAVGYDWRQSNKDSGQKLAQEAKRIMDQEEASHCIFVTHSMGGLVTRWALKQESDLTGKVLGVIHIAQPVDGAPALYRRFFTGTSSELDGGGLKDIIFNHMVGSDSRKLTLISSGMPGVFELLPNNMYKLNSSDPWVWYKENGAKKYWTDSDIYQLYLEHSSPPGLLWQGDNEAMPGDVSVDESMTVLPAEVRSDVEANVRGAKDFHQELRHAKHDKTWVIYGKSIETDVSTWFDSAHPPEPIARAGGGGDAYFVSRNVIEWPNRGVHRNTGDGDTVVPVASATALFPDQRHDPASQQPDDEHRQFGISVSQEFSHPNMCNSPEVHKLVGQMVYHILKLGPDGRPRQPGSP